MTEREDILPLRWFRNDAKDISITGTIPKAKEVSHFLLARIVGNVFDLNPCLDQTAHLTIY